MFSFNVRIINPWAKNKFQNIWNTYKQLTKNKVVEVQITKGGTELIGVSVDLSFRNQDHAGIYLEFGIIGYTASFTLYGRRHWNRDTDNWCEYHDTV